MRFGPLPGLLALQILAIVKTIAVCLYPNTQAIMWTLSPEQAVHYSLFNSAKELLYTPTDPAVKYRVKTLVETFLFRFGVCLGAVSVLLYFQFHDIVQLTWVTVLIAIANMAICITLARQYRTLMLLRAELEARK